MLPQERLHRIHSLLIQFKRISTEQIMNELNVSRETARRDMIELEALGSAKRVHGGLVLSTEMDAEAPLQIRNTQMVKEKRLICRAAIQQLRAGQTIFIDAGSTTTILAEELRTLSGLTILTNSLHAALQLMNTSEQSQAPHKIILLGGRVSHLPQTQGEAVIAEIYRYQADVCLLSPAGVDQHHGASNYAIEEAHIAQAMVKCSQRTIILADERKLGRVSRINYAKADEITMLITNQSKNKELLNDFKRYFKEVLVV